jgi:putative MFS transporter
MNFVEPHLENWLGRKAMLTFSLTFSGLMLFGTMLFPDGSLGIIILAWVGTFFCGVAFGAGYTYTKELYPTTLRTTALGTASAAARVGSILSPLMAAVGGTFGAVVPLVLYGAVMLSSGLASIWIWPETMKLQLPYTLEECEALANGRNSWTHVCRRRRVAPE